MIAVKKPPANPFRSTTIVEAPFRAAEAAAPIPAGAPFVRKERFSLTFTIRNSVGREQTVGTTSPASLGISVLVGFLLLLGRNMVVAKHPFRIEPRPLVLSVGQVERAHRPGDVDDHGDGDTLALHAAVPVAAARSGQRDAKRGGGQRERDIRHPDRPGLPDDLSVAQHVFSQLKGCPAAHQTVQLSLVPPALDLGKHIAQR